MFQYLPNEINTHTKKNIDAELMLLFTNAMQPFSVVEDKRFVAALNPAYALPTRQTIANSMLPTMFEKCNFAVREVIKDVKIVCITTDGWTAKNNVRFVADTAYFVDDTFELRSILLEACPMPESHTSTNLASKTKRILIDWGLQNNVVLAASDNLI